MSDKPDLRRAEMTFFKEAKTYYARTLDECGDINKSLELLKKKLVVSGAALPPAKWARLDKVLRSGEIGFRKRGTPAEWAAAELRLLK